MQLKNLQPLKLTGEKMKKNINLMLLTLTLIFPAVSSAETWTPFYRVTSNYFSVDKTIVVLDTDFHLCGNNKWGKLDYSVVGGDFAKTFNAALIAALAANHRVSVKVDGCIAGGNRANITGIRINNY